ncbi:hypothetical protein Scep_012175 [Stephania cephalantha]|uniref:Uncharacterized protein n=1 Tax=Stephania cephalantha TaxID=152367 RepID=A0AAP0JGT0_9MAGN
MKGRETLVRAMGETAKATPVRTRHRRWRGSYELLVQTPAKQRGSSSDGPAGWLDGRRGRTGWTPSQRGAVAPGSLQRRRLAAAAAR